MKKYLEERLNTLNSGFEELAKQRDEISAMLGDVRSKIFKTRLTLNKMDDVFGGFAVMDNTGTVYLRRPEDVLEMVCALLEVPVDVVKGRSRNARVVEVRQIFFYLTRKYTKATYDEIALLVGRDHTTVIHNVTAATNYMETEPQFRSRVAFIEERVKQFILSEEAKVEF